MAYDGSLTFNSGDELTAAELTQIMANFAAIINGSALGANIITASLLDLITRSGFLPTTALTRTADTTATLVGDWTDRIPVGAKYRWLSAGSMRQNYVMAVSYASGTGLTTITITPGYITSANDMCFKSGDAITVPQYSLADNPVGFPASFATSAKERLNMNGAEATIFGWNYLTGTAGGGQTIEAKTLALALTTLHSAVIGPLGACTGSAPATIGALNTPLGAGAIVLDFSAYGIAVTGFNAVLTRTDGGSSAGIWVGFSYEFKGTLS